MGKISETILLFMFEKDTNTTSYALFGAAMYMAGSGHKWIGLSLLIASILSNCVSATRRAA